MHIVWEIVMTALIISVTLAAASLVMGFFKSASTATPAQ